MLGTFKAIIYAQASSIALLLCGFFTINNHTYAQSRGDSLAYLGKYILDTAPFRAGVYKTFEEFKHNSPSIIDYYSVGKKAIWVTDATGKNRKLKKHETWGYCDGSRVFIKWRKFNEVVEKGRYCYFKETGTRMTYAVSGIPFMIIPIPTPYKDEVILNFNTGRSYRLTKKLLREILEIDDPELLESFNKESGKSKKLFDYIVKYNDRNAFRIK